MQQQEQTEMFVVFLSTLWWLWFVGCTSSIPCGWGEILDNNMNKDMSLSAAAI